MQYLSSAAIVIQIARHDGHVRQFSDFQVVQGLEEGGSPSLWQRKIVRSSPPMTKTTF